MRKGSNNLLNRKLLVMGIFIAIGVVYIIRLFLLQVVDKEYVALADNNALRYVTQYPARGKVYDRNGKLLVFNEAVYDLMVTPRQVAEAVKKDSFLALFIRSINDSLSISSRWQKAAVSKGFNVSFLTAS